MKTEQEIKEQISRLKGMLMLNLPSDIKENIKKEIKELEEQKD